MLLSMPDDAALIRPVVGGLDAGWRFAYPAYVLLPDAG